eukprot:222850-Chlamydomonas_euryale.AAC.1
MRSTSAPTARTMPCARVDACVWTRVCGRACHSAIHGRGGRGRKNRARRDCSACAQLAVSLQHSVNPVQRKDITRGQRGKGEKGGRKGRGQAGRGRTHPPCRIPAALGRSRAATAT